MCSVMCAALFQNRWVTDLSITTSCSSQQPGLCLEPHSTHHSPASYPP